VARARTDGDPRGFGLSTAILMLVAVVLAMSALVVAGQAWSRSNDAESSVAAASGTPVTLTEFAITPQMVQADVGGVLSVKNTGTVEHDLSIKGTDLKTPMLAPGETASLDLGDLEAGAYDLQCDVAGHAGAGMTGMLHLGNAAAASDESASAGVNTAANDASDELMSERTKAFPAKTEGTGAQLLAPTVLVDGTKRFDLTAKVTDWEVEPGEIVQASTYNGVVPGPTIKVAPGEHVQVVLKNELSESTSIHYHGIIVPNAMDGVPDITQPPIKPGETFTYDFVAQGPAVGIYHSHHHAEHQVPDGLFAPFIVGDLPLPAGVAVSQEIPMVLNDAGVIGLTLNGKSFPATAPIAARLGEWVEIHYLNEGLQAHPMHLHGMPQLVIAKDGIPLAQPYSADTILVGPGERYSVLVHATELGTWAFHCHILNHAESDQGMFGMVTAFVVS
jgi:FtsP/CotA-like multicopper oxidase with cupredoxin domain